MKIYLAARFGWKERLLEYSGYLHSIGHEVTSSWLDTVWLDQGGTTAAPADRREEWAEKDLEDIDKAEYFVYFAEGTPARGGCHVELGYAIANYMSGLLSGVVVIGEPEHLFHYHPDVKRFESWEKFLEWLMGDY